MTIKLIEAVLRVSALGLALLVAPAAFAQDYPSRPIRFVVPYTPGGGNDIVARTVGQKLSEAWNTNVIVENRPGGNAFIGTEYVARQPADGYTVLIGDSSTHATSPHLFAKMPYDVTRDFAPVTALTYTAVVLIVNPSEPYQNVRQIVDAAKSKTVNYATFGHGSTAHLFGELLTYATKASFEHVAYKGSAPALNDVMGGQVPAAFLSIAGAKAQIAAGRVRALAVTGPARWRALPEVPTFGEAGFPGFEVVGWIAAFVPAGTNRAIINKLAAEMTQIVRSPDVAKRLIEFGTDPAGGSPDEFAATWKRGLDTFGEIVRNAKIKPE